MSDPVIVGAARTAIGTARKGMPREEMDARALRSHQGPSPRLTLIHELARRGGGIGVASMCAGGVQVGAVLVEV